jgi:hypothetical protein
VLFSLLRAQADEALNFILETPHVHADVNAVLRDLWLGTSEPPLAAADGLQLTAERRLLGQ